MKYFISTCALLGLSLSFLFFQDTFESMYHVLKEGGSTTFEQPVYEEKTASPFYVSQTLLEEELPEPLTRLEKVISLKNILSGKQKNVVLNQSELVRITNIHRADYGLGPLKEDKRLSASALKKTEDMIAKKYFEHLSPSGIGVKDLAQEAGYSYLYVGENLAVGTFTSEEDLIQAWMDSPAHKENILNTKYQDIGIAVLKGTYQGRNVWYGVQHFGLSKNLCPQVSSSLRSSIDLTRQSIVALNTELEALLVKIEESTNDIDKLIRVDSYNSKVIEYNEFVQKERKLISEYNGEVKKFNECFSSF